ncbi:hypothetical protein K469DRAFT_707362 [Zopfia rhizophila CBS 207.26]|uniref:Uncharacterized protein n=1 Tax=Zopfia rhizophila CBS 207.26 TaxID=1314779 RepID=A0A6A6E526_9PEZI|nr:hypothetical protein K469DRAFT_707362 [Zopfia rhizophila CBS 207.26]
MHNFLSPVGISFNLGILSDLLLCMSTNSLASVHGICIRGLTGDPTFLESIILLRPSQVLHISITRSFQHTQR